MRQTLFIIFLLSIGFCEAQDFSLYEKHYYNAPELNLPYRLLRPAVSETSKKYPLVIFLHGANERGFDNEAQLNIGGRFFLRDSIRQAYPAYVLFPQCPEVDTWAYFIPDESDPGKVSIKFPFPKKPTEVSVVLMRLLDSLIHTGSIDTSRIYIAGLSQGGMGVLDLIARYPQTFAAGLAICGGGDATTAKYFAGKTSLWLFHGDQDDVIPVSFSRAYFKRLKKLDADVRYSEYPGVKHNSWVNAFSEAGLMQWIFSKKKA
jgi:predicted peptidase